MKPRIKIIYRSSQRRGGTCTSWSGRKLAANGPISLRASINIAFKPAFTYKLQFNIV